MNIIAENGPTERMTKGSFVKESIISVYESWKRSVLFIIILLGPVFFCLFMLFPPFWKIGIPYLCWILIDWRTPYRGGRMNHSFRYSKIWKLARDYFPIKLIKTCEIPADKNYIFTTFPHSLFPFGMFANFVTAGANDFQELFPGIEVHGLTLNKAFIIPVVRDITLLLGGCSASEDSMKYILNGPPGSSCMVNPGGAQELLKTVLSKYNIVLKNRKGFVRVALKTGASLVPVFTFNETRTYRHCTAKWFKKLESIVYSKFGLFIPIGNGRGYFQNSFGLFPLKIPLSTVVGKPIDLPKIENPTNDDIDKYHSIFVKELEELFNKYKEKYDLDGKNAVLIIE